MNNSFWSHCTFRNMTTAAWNLVCNGFSNSADNNAFEYCNFVDCGAGFLQRTQNGSNIVSYADKNNFFRCQWIRSGMPVDMLTTRDNNLNVFVDCFAKDCSGYFSFDGPQNYLAMVNCVIQNCGGANSVPIQGGASFINLIACSISGAAGNRALTTAETMAEGCTFSLGNASAATCKLVDYVIAAPFVTYMMNGCMLNCVNVDVPVGAIDAAPTGSANQLSYAFYNCAMPASEARWSAGAAMTQYNSQGTVTTGDDARTSNIPWVAGTALAGTRMFRDRTA
jgi:hypothetical protein